MKFSEGHVEDAALEWLSELGYAVLQRSDISPDGAGYGRVLVAARKGRPAKVV